MKIENPFPSLLPSLRLLWQEAFGDTENFIDSFFSTAFCTDRCRCITADNHAVAALYWFDCLYKDKPIAYIYAVATAKAFRGQGICHKLMEDTHRHLASLGYEGAILVPGSPHLFHFYEDMGYQTCCHISKIRVAAAGTKKEIGIRPVGKEEFAMLRRQFLPEGAVIQEHTNLSFLETQAQFFTSPGFLLTASMQNGTVYGLELLGNTSLCAEITAALDCIKGTFRTPGTDFPLAMYRPLGKSTLPPPVYFGFPFD